MLKFSTDPVAVAYTAFGALLALLGVSIWSSTRTQVEVGPRTHARDHSPTRVLAYSDPLFTRSFRSHVHSLTRSFVLCARWLGYRRGRHRTLASGT